MPVYILNVKTSEPHDIVVILFHIVTTTEVLKRSKKLSDSSFVLGVGDRSDDDAWQLSIECYSKVYPRKRTILSITDTTR